MEGFILKYKQFHHLQPINVTTEKPKTSTEGHIMGQYVTTTQSPTNILLTNIVSTIPYNKSYGNEDNFTLYGNSSADNLTKLIWGNDGDFNGDLPWDNWANTTDLIGVNGTDVDAFNATLRGFWFCAQWTAAQHELFQAAHLVLAIAFMVPHGCKQGALMVRTLLSLGFLLAALWAGSDICAPDVMIWNIILMLANVFHTISLIIRLLPPGLSVELTELYLRLFKPLKVSKKHFSELAREARLLQLDPGDPYAMEEVSPADERLSILLKGKLKVSCDETHLHYINPHQFIDSPEWEANHEHSDDVFQVTITAEEDCLYLCWPRMRLERVLRHRPALKAVLDSIIGKDITGKLYALNEHLGVGQTNSNGTAGSEGPWARSMARSLSVDAVHTGTRGHVRSLVWRAQHDRRESIAASDKCSPARKWIPVVANQFPPTSPFPLARLPSALPGAVPVLPPHPVGPPMLPLCINTCTMPPVPPPGFEVAAPIVIPILAPPPPAPRPQRKQREVKFAEEQVKVRLIGDSEV